MASACPGLSLLWCRERFSLCPWEHSFDVNYQVPYLHSSCFVQKAAKFNHHQRHIMCQEDSRAEELSLHLLLMTLLEKSSNFVLQQCGKYIFYTWEINEAMINNIIMLMCKVSWVLEQENWKKTKCAKREMREKCAFLLFRYSLQCIFELKSA